MKVHKYLKNNFHSVLFKHNQQKYNAAIISEVWFGHKSENPFLFSQKSSKIKEKQE